MFNAVKLNRVIMVILESGALQQKTKHLFLVKKMKQLINLEMDLRIMHSQALHSTGVHLL